MREGLKATQKDGFCEYIRTYPSVLEYKIKPSDVPLPPNAKAIKARLPVLEKAAKQARGEAEKVMQEVRERPRRRRRRLAKPIVADYRKLGAKLKPGLPPQTSSRPMSKL